MPTEKYCPRCGTPMSKMFGSIRIVYWRCGRCSITYDRNDKPINPMEGKA